MDERFIKTQTVNGQLQTFSLIIRGKSSSAVTRGDELSSSVPNTFASLKLHCKHRAKGRLQFVVLKRCRSLGSDFQNSTTRGQLHLNPPGLNSSVKPCLLPCFLSLFPSISPSSFLTPRRQARTHPALVLTGRASES